MTTHAEMAGPKWGRYEYLRPAQIHAIREAIPLAYLPWGALEWHSYHNPIGLDGLKAHGLCLALAGQTGGIVLPPLYLGTDTIKPFKGFPDSLEHARETVTRVCTEFLEQLVSEGFRVIVVLTGHYGAGHVAALSAAVTAFTQQHPTVKVWFLPDSAPLEGSYPADHAGITETSWQLFFDPTPVDLALCPPGRSPSLDEDGVLGDDPRGASPERGAEMLEVFLARTVPYIQQLVQEVSA